MILLQKKIENLLTESHIHNSIQINTLFFIKGPTYLKNSTKNSWYHI